MEAGMNAKRGTASVQVLLQEAQRALAVSDYQGAIDLLQQAHKSTSSRRQLPIILVNLVGAYVGAEDLVGCWYYTKVFWQALTFEEQQPVSAEILYHVGAAYELMGRWSSAAESYQHALWVSSAGHPDFPKREALIRLATCMAKSDRTAEAEEILAEVGPTRPGDELEAEANVAKALVALIKGELDLAANLAERALRSKEATARIRCRACIITADVMQDRAEYSEAFSWLEEAAVQAVVADSDVLTDEVLARMEMLTSERQFRNPT